MANNVLLLWLAALPLMGSPGPLTLSLAGFGAAFGCRPVIGYLLGAILGTYAVLLLIASGVTALLLAQPALVTILTGLAMAYILYLAWRIASAPIGMKDSKAKAAPVFWSGFVVALANPKAFAAIGAVYASHDILEGDLMGNALAKTLALACVVIVVNTSWLGFGSVFFQHPQPAADWTGHKHPFCDNADRLGWNCPVKHLKLPVISIFRQNYQ